MIDEFNLSEKQHEVYGGELDAADYMQKEGYEGYCNVIKVEDVKEFIRRLKKEFGEMLINTSYLWKSAEIIDKLAGEKLK